MGAMGASQSAQSAFFQRVTVQRIGTNRNESERIGNFVFFFSSRARMFSRKHLMPPSTATSLTIDVPSADIGVAQQLRLRCALLLIAHSLPNIPRQRHMIEPFAIPLTHPARADRSLQRGPIVRVENASRLKVTRKVVVLPP